MLFRSPISLVTTGEVSRNKLEWSECPDLDYKHTKIYRSETTAWADAVPIGKIKANMFVDDSLIIGTSYYYYISHIDTSGNESVVYPSIAGAGVIGIPNQIVTAHVSPGAITDGLTDQTPVGIPTGLTITQLATDVDEDGKVDIAFQIAWNAVTGAKSYGLQITQGSDVTYELIDDTSKIIKVKSNKLYSVKVRTLSHFRQAGPVNRSRPASCCPDSLYHAG